MIYDGREVIFIDYERDQMASFSLPDGLVGIAISGGLDSTTLFYAICQYITDLNLNVQILPIHSVKKRLWNTLHIADSILDDVKMKYPNVKILDLEIYFYDEGVYWESGIKKNSLGDFYKNLYEKYENLNFIMAALTALPSYDIVSKWKCGINIDRVEKNNLIHYYYENGTYLFRPLAMCDKKLIANIFHYLKLPKRYLKDTWTCTFFSDQTKNFTEPCGSCYHCWEKKWAFGQF